MISYRDDAIQDQGLITGQAIGFNAPIINQSQ